MRKYEKVLERKIESLDKEIYNECGCCTCFGYSPDCSTCCLREKREELNNLEEELAKLRGFECHMEYCDFLIHLYFILGLDELPFDTSYYTDKWIEKLGR